MIGECNINPATGFTVAKYVLGPLDIEYFSVYQFIDNVFYR